ncbi:polygalacturonase inhibitor-like [Oryza brachyantha]|uniref:Leucine-rich repeat-containing N-terminal plant-type domain-containing protein n=1 Tax=Oryza brachyantha TaxID=4533 RepID=J3M364_ORYBR|nr:polygalacturonase inhibitor-like [Oryza brachyantha]
MRSSVVVAAAVVLLLAAHAVSAATKKKDCNAGDKAALLAIKSALGDPYHFASWTPDNPCCDWYDVDCDDSTGRVVGLSVFQDANLTGTIPDAVANLTRLRTLVWHHLPNLSGPIPPALAKLSRLSMLIISWTAVSGPVPSFLGALKSLTLLDLSFNSLTGAIPPSLAALPYLSSVDISRNRLSGTLPPALFSKLNGSQGAYLRLSRNNLTGGIPGEYGGVRFEQMDLSRNALSFNMTGLRLREGEGWLSLELSHNMMYGSVPAQVAGMANLHYLNVSYNRLCGELPAGAARFDQYSFLHNKCLCGPPLLAACN